MKPMAIAPVLGGPVRSRGQIETKARSMAATYWPRPAGFSSANPRARPWRAARGLCALLDQIGLQGAAVATPAGVLHFKSDCSLLDEETILATSRLGARRGVRGFRVVMTARGRRGAANAVRVNDRVLMSDAFPRTAEKLERAGLRAWCPWPRARSPRSTPGCRACRCAGRPLIARLRLPDYGKA